MQPAGGLYSGDIGQLQEKKVTVHGPAGSGFTYGANDMIFCGYRYDPETRLYYVRNRMFLTDTGGASVGRWLQRDPIGYAGGINLYEYVEGRAVVTVDPDGTNPVTVTETYFCIPAAPQLAACFGQCTCTVGKPFAFGTLVTNFTVEFAMAVSLLSCCEGSCTPCTVFHAPKPQPYLMSVCMTLAISAVFTFSTTTCTCT